MPNIAETIKEHIADALEEVPANITLEHPADISHGDYASNAALVFGKKWGRNPRELAEEVVASLDERKPDAISHVEVAGPGFINFHLSETFFTQTVEHIRSVTDTWGANTCYAGERTMVEYTDPNPFNEMHVGHVMSNTIGESISRLIQFSGAEVKRVNYQGDVGVHVAKALWGLQQKELSPDDVSELNQGYAHGARAYEEDPEAKIAIDAINRSIYEKDDPELVALYERGRKTSLAHFEEIYEQLGTAFDMYFFESESGILGKELVEENARANDREGVFEEHEGAVIFRGEEHDPSLHTRVFINTAGLPTYEAKELGLAKLKYDRWSYDKSVVITGNEVVDYFRVVHAAMEKVLPHLAERTEHVAHGMLRLPEGKMSSRTGDVITAERLISEMKERSRAVMNEPDDTIAEYVAVAAIKYAIVRQSTGRNVVFDPEASLSFEGDSGPYLQYAYTRARAVIEKAEAENISPSEERGDDPVVHLEQLLYRFPEVVERAAREREPHYVTTYLTELAGAFNTYYHDHRIADGENPGWRLSLTYAFRQTMENGLWLLGIETPERM